MVTKTSKLIKKSETTKTNTNKDDKIEKKDKILVSN